MVSFCVTQICSNFSFVANVRFRRSSELSFLESADASDSLIFFPLSHFDCF